MKLWIIGGPLAALAVMLLLMAGCTTTLTACPAPQEYSKEFQRAAASELKAFKGQQPHVNQMIVDYGKVRARLRACQ